MHVSLPRPVLSRLSDPVFLLDDAGEVIGFNPAAHGLLESSPGLAGSLERSVLAVVPHIACQPLRLALDTPVFLREQPMEAWLSPGPDMLALVFVPALGA